MRRVNDTTWAQPRRVTMSLPAGGEDDRHLFAYTQAKRPPSDWRCRVMPTPFSDLMMYLYEVARPFLGPVSAARPPNAIQMMLYYTAFQSRVSRHRDNFCTADFDSFQATGVDPSGSARLHTSATARQRIRTLRW